MFPKFTGMEQPLLKSSIFICSTCQPSFMASGQLQLDVSPAAHHQCEALGEKDYWDPLTTGYAGCALQWRPNHISP